MGSMGKRRGRRTRSDSGPDPEGWPEFRHNQWTFEGSVERAGALGRGRRLIRERGGRRTISNRDLLVPIVTATLLLAGIVLVVGLVLTLIL